MKKSLLFFITFLFSFCGFCFAAQVKSAGTDETGSETENKSVFNFETSKYASEKWSNVPAAKRPATRSEDELIHGGLNSEKSMDDEYVKKCNDTFKYGLESEITDLIDELTTSEDYRFVNQIYDLFQETKNPSLKEKILKYFTKIKDPCLEDYAVEIINDPYDQKKAIVSQCFLYIAAVDCKEAIPGIVELVDKEEEDYFTGALTCLGEIGGKDEALFLADYLDRDDLSVAQKQSLMRVLGKIKAVETWDKMVEIVEDDNENAFVRSYAAEAIGAMEKPEGEDILINLFESDDPTLRTYVIKGISHFKDDKADALLIQGVKDSHKNVRLEAVNAVADRKLSAAVPYLVYRCKDKSEEDAVKNKCYETIAALNTAEGNEYLIGLLTDQKKVPDRIKIKVSAALLKENTTGSKEILSLAEESLKADNRKPIRYALGKELAKYGRPEYEEICGKYIDSADVATQGTGLDIYAKGRYAGLKSKVAEIAKDADPVEQEKNTEQTTSSDSKNGKTTSIPAAPKKANANAKKAKAILERINSYENTEGKSSASQASTAAHSSQENHGPEGRTAVPEK